MTRPVRVEQADGTVVDGDLDVSAGAHGVVVFAHGSGSSRHSPRNHRVAAALHDRGLATLLMDLLTAEEEAVDVYSRRHRFDIALLGMRLLGAAAWVAAEPTTRDLPIGYFGASTGAAAALVAASRGVGVAAIVSRGGRPDLAGDDALRAVRAPTLLLVGERDQQVLELNRSAQTRMTADCRLVLIPRAGHLFEEPGALDQVAQLAGDWFTCHFRTNGDALGE
jgi:putative phosphoribosyl transferase